MENYIIEDCLVEDYLLLTTIIQFLEKKPSNKDDKGYVWYMGDGAIALEKQFKQLWFIGIEEQIDLKTKYALNHLARSNGYEVRHFEKFIDDEE